jgi:uncharacterized membrane protein
MQPRDFLSEADEQQIVHAIEQAEELTSGEIRIHLESTFSGDHFQRAQEIFVELGMHETAQRNGVLIYVAYDDHALYVIGDEGINSRVETDFWTCTVDAMLEKFRQDAFCEGLLAGVNRAGERLATLFPRTINQQNELANTLSKG